MVTVKWVQEWADDIRTFRQETVRDDAAQAFIDDLAQYGIVAWTEKS